MLLGAFVTRQLDVRAIEQTAWPALVKLAERHGLGQLLLWAAGQAALHPPLQDAFAPLLAQRPHATVRSLLTTQTQDRVQQALSAQGIPCIWLKGSVLAQTIYPAPELRPMVDVDLLAPYAQREAARAAVEALGYRLADQLLDGSDELKHHYTLIAKQPDKQPDAVMVELHFRLLGAADRLLTLDQLAWFWGQTEPWSGPGLRLRPEAHLLYLAAHALLQHGEAALRLLWFYDLHALLQHTPTFDWTLAVDQGVRLGWTYVLGRALALAQRHFGTAIPDGVLAELAARRPSHEQLGHAQRRQRRRTLSETVLDDLATMGWPTRLRAAGRILAPPPSYMRRRYAVQHTWQLPAAYWTRWRTMSADAGRTLRRRVADRNPIR
jgi:hypothetical protein